MTEDSSYGSCLFRSSWGWYCELRSLAECCWPALGQRQLIYWRGRDQRWEEEARSLGIPLGLKAGLKVVIQGGQLSKFSYHPVSIHSLSDPFSQQSHGISNYPWMIYLKTAFQINGQLKRLIIFVFKNEGHLIEVTETQKDNYHMYSLLGGF